MKWVKHNESQRRQYLSDLMKHVRFPTLTRKFLAEEVKNNSLIQSSMHLKILYEEAVQCYDNPMHRLSLSSSLNRPRTIRKDYDLGFIVRLHNTSMQYYDPYTNKIHAKNLNFDYSNADTVTVSLNQKLYLLRTFATNRITYTNLIFDPVTLNTRKFAPLNSFRKDFGACALNAKIYVCGGVTLRGEILNTVERFDPVKNKWDTLPPMSQARNGPGVVALNGFLYVIGGIDNNYAFLESVSHLSYVVQHFIY